MAGANALLTGASGGIGRHIARALGDAGVRLAVSGRQHDTLEQLCESLRPAGAIAEPVVADLADPEQTAAAYPAFTDHELSLLTQVNLVAPMVLARHVLPGMLDRGSGHIVTVSSLAGRGGNAYNVLYATTKAGLVGFTRSLRAELEGTPVGASVVCPGFVAHDGMYAEMQQLGLNAPLALRAVEPERVARSVLEAIAHDQPDVLITGWPMRPLLAIQEMAPRLAQRITDVTGARDFFAQVAERRLRT